MTRSDLAVLKDGDGAVARQGARIISRTRFLAETAELAEFLPDRPYVVNFCSDRYRFVVAWTAAMLRGQVTLLPSSRDAAAVAALRPDYSALYVLTDDEVAADWPASLQFSYPALGAAGPPSAAHRIAAFPAEQVAAMLFTSGSTGRPNPSPRLWGRLVAGSLAAGAALAVERFPDAAVIATVPHAHSYGLESAVMLPLQHGLLLTAERPFFPADVAAALEAEPGILVTTPVHLRALVGDASGPGFADPGVATSLRVGFVLSATAPLSAELAAQAEAAFRAPVLEIYGCSEAGQLATRRTIDGPIWRCLKGFRLFNDAAGCWAAGPVEPDMLLADQIDPVGPDGFILRGRIADLVNVAGKRSSLSYLTAQLLAIEGVKDGVFVMPDDAGIGATPRLVAVALAPGLTAASILGELRDRIDAAFLPRPLHVVDSLPRNDLGKLARADLLRLIGLPPTQAAQAESSAAKVPEPIVLGFAADHPVGPGHFPGNAIIPGAVLLDELIAVLFPSGWSGKLESAKFHHPVRPGDSVAVTRRTEDGLTRFECRLAGNQQLVLSGVLRTPFPPQ
ncbi:AMP-binding protein [Rhodopila sp.]|uniref:AMP-binding protein n=1 Tax=Rhodopila sp. TaxID=2480087 RepID=UPI003D151EB0